MAANIKVFNARDFRGGLNLRGDGFELDENESPDMLNVDIDARGGVEQRKGIVENAVVISNPNLLSVAAADNETAQGWASSTNGTASWDTVGASGTKSTRITAVAVGSAYGVAESAAGFKPVTTGLTYSAFAKCRWRVGGTPKVCRLNIFWYTAGAVFISSTVGTSVMPNTTTWVSIIAQGVAPATATQCLILFEIVTAATADAAAVDQAHFAQGVNSNHWLDPAVTNQLPGEINAACRFEISTVAQYFVQSGGGLFYHQLGAAANTWTSIGAIGTLPFRAVQFKDKLYFVGGTTSFSWDGTTIVILGTAFNDNLAAPTGLNMPVSKLVTAFQGSVFVVEQANGNRLRWSHPNQPADFRSFDYVDIDTGLNAETITALVPLQERLLIFKTNSVYALVGIDPSNFTVFPVSREQGTISQDTVVNTDLGVFFCSYTDGVFHYDGRNISWKFDRVRQIFTEGQVDTTTMTVARIGWSNRRLWLSLPWRATRADSIPTSNTRTFVFDPAVSKNGAWTAYSFGVGIMFELVFANLSLAFLGARPGVGRLFTLESTAVTTPYDVMISGNTHISSYFVTKWYDLGQPGQRKRWRRPEFVVLSTDAILTLPVDVRKDYDPQVVARSFNVLTSVDPDTSIGRSELVRGPTLGNARAVQLKINGPSTNKHWGVNMIAFKYIPQPVRS